MRGTKNWIAVLVGLALLTFVLSATPARLSVSNRQAVIEGAAPGTRVTLFDGATEIGAASVDQSGRAGFGELHLSPGDHVLRVREWGTGWGVGDPVNMSVNAPRAKGSTPTTIALSNSANPSYFGQPLTLRAVVTPSSATGAVTFYDGTTVLGITTLTAGIASLTTTMPAFGTRPFKAYYAGNPVYAPSTSPSLSQTISVPAQNGFQPVSMYPTNHLPSTVAIGDFNGDGKPDLAVANGNDNNTVSILLADPNPPLIPGGPPRVNFRPPVDYSTGDTPVFVTVGDFNGDGRLDLAVTNLNGFNISILLGHGDGTFQPSVQYPTGGFYPTWLTLADFDGDGNVDLVVVGAGSTVNILLGNGDGTFRPPGLILPDSYSPGFVASADFNGDGKADLAITTVGGKVIILLGDGDGSFQSPVSYDAPIADSFVVADVNGDGKMDLVVANGGSQSVSVLLGRGDGTFQPAVQHNVGLGPYFYYLAVGDFNGDGIADLAVTPSNRSFSSNVIKPGDVTLAILLGTPQGTFASGGSYAVGELPAGIAVEDLNGDARSDVVVTDGPGGFSVFLGVPAYLGSAVSLSDNSPNPTTLSRPVTLTARVTPAMATGKVTFFDGVRLLGEAPVNLGAASFTTTLLPFGAHTLKAHYSGDPVYAGSDSPAVAQTVFALPENGFRSPLTLATGMSVFCMALGDFNGDGTPDLVIADNNGDQVTILLGNGDGTFRTGGQFVAGLFPTSIVVGDFNGDGKSDLAVTATQQIGINGSQSLFGLNVLLGNGDGTFQPAVGYNTGNGAASAVVADFNRDGKPDLTIASTVDDTITIMQGNGDGTFRALLFHSGIRPVSVGVQALDTVSLAVGDFNGDGIPDLIVAGHTMMVALGNGDGTFRPSYITNTGDTYALAVGDFNGDGRLDFVVSATDPVTDSQVLVTVFLGNGDGTFIAKDGFDAGVAPVRLAVVDFNGDGIPDLAFAALLGEIGTFLGNGRDGTFQKPVVTYAVSQPTALVAGDFNGDGGIDLAESGRADDNVRIFLGKPAAPTQVTLQTSPPGLMISVDGGIPMMTPVTLSLTQGLHTLAAPSPEAGPVGQRYVFSNWSDGGSASHQIAVPAAPITYTATFGVQFLLTTSVAPAGAGTISVTSKSPSLDGYYNPGSGVTVTANPAAGYSFSGFSGALTGTTNPQLLSMTAPATLSAGFTAIPPVQNPTIFGAIANKTTQGSTTTLTLVLSNTGTSPAQLVTLTSLTAGVLTGTGSVSVTVPALPYSAGALQPGAVANVTVQLTITGTVSRVRLLFGGTMQNTVGAPSVFSGAAQVLIP